jgi:predicted regulator of Ras-like GTPase activity (Roadblock/LC7/MglB family)
LRAQQSNRISTEPERLVLMRLSLLYTQNVAPARNDKIPSFPAPSAPSVKARTYRKLVAKKQQEDALLQAAATPPSTDLSTSNDSASADSISSDLPSINSLISNSLPLMAYSKNNPAGQTVDAIITDLPGLMAVAVVDVTSGMALASHTNSPNINPETAAAYNTEVVKQKQKAMSALKLTGENIEDILITLTNQLHLLKLNAAGNKFIYLVVNSRETNLAIAREVLRSHAATMN